MSTPRKIARSFLYILGGGYTARIASVLLTILIRRALGPDVFEAMIRPVVVFALFTSLSQVGLIQALIHFRDDSETFLATHFTLNLLVSLAVCALTSAVAIALWQIWPAEWAWGAVVICILAGLQFLRNLTQTSEALMRRDFEFGPLSLLHGLGTVAALCAALAAARAGWGAWSLLIGGWTNYAASSAVYVVIFATGVWILRRVPLRLSLDAGWTRRLVTYGAWLWGGWVLQSFVWFYDKLVLGALVSDRDLAFYENAWWLMLLPTAVISHIILNYTTALYARYQDDRQRLGELFTAMMSLVVRCSAPVAVALVLLAPQLIALLGPEWGPSATLMVWLALFGVIRPLLDEGYGLLWACGDAKGGTIVMGLQAVVAVPLIPMAASWFGARGVALAMGGVTLWGALVLWRRVGRHIHVGWGQVLGAPVAACAAAASAGWYFGDRDVTAGAAFAAVYAGLLLILDRHRLLGLAAQARVALAVPRKG